MASGIIAHEAELRKLIAERDAIIAEKNAALTEMDDDIYNLEALVASSVGPDEISLFNSRLSQDEAEKELERRKARHFRLQVVIALAAKQTL